MKNQKYIFILLCILAVVLFIFSIKTVERWTQQESGIIFFSQKDTSAFLRDDKDGYVSSLSPADLYARKAHSATDYINNIATCASSFTDIEQKKLIRCCRLADDFLKSYTYRNMIKCIDISKIRWKLAITRKLQDTRKKGVHQYEEGLPHTRGDVIFLSEYVINDNIATGEDDMMLTNTLIHEKVHIYQRYNEGIVGKVIEKMGHVVAPNTNTPLKRSNPDINDKNYYDRNGNLFIFEYTSETPENINDVVNGGDFASEHPYERMAYEIANEYTKREMHDMTIKII